MRALVCAGKRNFGDDLVRNRIPVPTGTGCDSPARKCGGKCGKRSESRRDGTSSRTSLVPEGRQSSPTTHYRSSPSIPRAPHSIETPQKEARSFLIRDRRSNLTMPEQELEIPMPQGSSDSVFYYPEGNGKWPGVLYFTDIGGIRAANR